MSHLIDAREKWYDIVLKQMEDARTGLKELEEWKEKFVVKLNKQKDVFITLDELKQLMQWKLKKGKFRPTLMKLVGQNNEKDVESISKEAFKIILDHKNNDLDEDEYVKLIKKALTILIKLKGIGPATASLILSLLHTSTSLAPPFFSDEAALHIFDHSHKLKYSITEYIQYLRLFYQLNPKLEYDFTELEQGAWTLELYKEEEPTPKKRRTK